MKRGDQFKRRDDLSRCSSCQLVMGKGYLAQPGGGDGRCNICWEEDEGHYRTGRQSSLDLVALGILKAGLTDPQWFLQPHARQWAEILGFDAETLKYEVEKYLASQPKRPYNRCAKGGLK